MVNPIIDLRFNKGYDDNFKEKFFDFGAYPK